MVFDREDLEGLSKKELKDIIVAQSKAIERLRAKNQRLSERIPHRDMTDMDSTYYNPYEFGKLWFV